MPKVTRKDGSVVSWTGLGMCYCTECEELFNSEAAFEAHLTRRVVDKEGRRNANFSKAEHDYSHMPRNDKGILVTGLMPKDYVDSLKKGN